MHPIIKPDPLSVTGCRRMQTASAYNPAYNAVEKLDSNTTSFLHKKIP
jgi:hypothetical protein